MHSLMSRYYDGEDQGTEPGEVDGLPNKARQPLIFAFYEDLISPHSLSYRLGPFGSGIPDKMDPG